MIKNNVWEKSQNVFLKVADDINPGFDIGFDKRIPKDIEEENRNCAKTCFQYKIDLYKDNAIPHPRFMIHYDEPAFYELDGSAEQNYDKTIVVKNKKLKMTITQRMSVYENADDAYKAFIDWRDKVRKDALKARIEAI